ncbi:Uncharacterized protein TCM_009580 [Theobroma cacao]|uniref:Transposase-associated domain-containing protein n=1 Tax=Theobroma cacao TaxID=3641 RepID=A0A061ECT2_THECC|nr:Uncharacterized protein TCM_009580 [Theobroma cacao]
MERDQSWMYQRLTPNGFMRDELMNGIQEFIYFASFNPTFIWGNKTRCPCSQCSNTRFLSSDKVEVHFLKKGFIGAYTIWSLHGEHELGQSTRSRDGVEPYSSHREHGEPIYEKEIENQYYCNF